MSRVRRILSTDAAYTLVVARLSRALLSLISAPLIARSIGAEGRGETAAAFAAFYIVPILVALGMPLELRRSASLGRLASTLRAARMLTFAAILPSTAVAVILYATLFAGLRTDARITAAASIALAPVMIDWMCSENVLLALGKFRTAALMQVIHPIGLLFLVTTLVAMGFASVASIVAANFAACLPSALIGRIALRNELQSESGSPLGLLRRSLSFAGASAAEAATNRLDQVLVLPLIGAYEAGLYSVAVTVGMLPLAFGQALGAVYFRTAARSAVNDRGVVVTRGVREGIALGLLTSAVLAALTPLVVPLVFGAAFRPAVWVTVVVLAGSAFCAAGYVCSMILAAEGSGKRMTVAQLFALLCTIIALAVFGPMYGAVGAAVASTFGYILLLVSATLMLHVGPLAAIPRPRDFRASLVELVSGVAGRSGNPNSR